MNLKYVIAFVVGLPMVIFGDNLRGDAVDHQDERALWTLDSSNRRNNRKDTRRNRYNNRKVTRRNVNRRKFKKAWDRGYYDDWDRTFDDDFDFDNDLSAAQKRQIARDSRREWLNPNRNEREEINEQIRKAEHGYNRGWWAEPNDPDYGTRNFKEKREVLRYSRCNRRGRTCNYTADLKTYDRLVNRDNRRGRDSRRNFNRRFRDVDEWSTCMDFCYSRTNNDEDLCDCLDDECDGYGTADWENVCEWFD